MFSARSYLPGQAKEGSRCSKKKKAKEGSHMHTNEQLYIHGQMTSGKNKMTMERKQRLTDN